MSSFADETEDLVFWSSAEAPIVLTTIASEAQASGPETLDLRRLALPIAMLRQPDGRLHLLILDGPRRLQIEVVVTRLFRDPVRLLIPVWPPLEDEPRVLALRRFLHLRAAGALPDQLYRPERRGLRWADMLRAHDARLAGASHREIAAALFGQERVRDDWAGSSDYLRLRVQRLVRAGDRMVGGGYRDLLR
ncbi:DUF2285 domain-containing protein [Rhodospira trueperi]|uniref:T6SS Transcription factor RovC-like DNA binding domain-containing protein n=1 Tax=Rhodospira trueperi TaxID=69960 RepID=A0A1G7ICE1_9PROT|nr:DUF2285 domain-containing protein [Rhodospira trueperi]SDF10380.1 hypothetical protein SAMN05421720_1351 [Rhodospira trueperi]